MHERVLYRFFCPEEKFSENFGIRAVDIMIVFRKISAPIFTVVRRQLIPRNSRVFMMDEMQVIKQEQKRDWAVLLNDYGAFTEVLGSLVFQEGSDQQE